MVRDYNELPEEGTVLHLEEVDPSNTGIMHNGFAHFKGCDYITKVKLHKCDYLEDRALAELHYLKNTLTSLQVSSCPNISKGLIYISVLSKLKELILFDLQFVEDKYGVIQSLQENLPQCNIRLIE